MAQLVEWTRGGLGLDVVRKSGDQSSTTTSLANVTDLLFAVEAGQVYSFEFWVPFSTPALTTGLGLAVTCPASPGLIAYEALIPIANDGTGGTFHGHGTASGDTILSTAVATINTVFLAHLRGVLRNGVNAGNLQLQFRTEIAGSAASVKQGAWGVCWSG